MFDNVYKFIQEEIYLILLIGSTRPKIDFWPNRRS